MPTERHLIPFDLDPRGHSYTRDIINIYAKADRAGQPSSGVIKVDYFRVATGAYIVPEPATMLILCLGGVLALLRRR